MEPDYNKSLIAKKADQLLKNDKILTLFSSFDEGDNEPRVNAEKKTISRKSDKNIEYVPKISKIAVKSSIKRAKSLNKATNKNRGNNRVNTTVIFDKDSHKKCSADHHDFIEDNGIPCLQQKYLLKTKVHDLEKIVANQDKKLKKLMKKISKNKEEMAVLNERLHDYDKKNHLVEELENKLLGFKENEHNLTQEISNQQKLNKETLSQLTILKEENNNEIEKMRKYYKSIYSKRFNDEREVFEAKIQKLQIEKDKLINDIETIETEKNLEKTKESLNLSNQIVYLNNQLSQKSLENDRLKAEIRELKSLIRDNEKNALSEIKSLRNSLEMLTEENKMLRNNEDPLIRKEINERIMLKKKIEDLEDILAKKELQLREKDYTYKTQLEGINTKMLKLQGELSKIVELEKNNESLEKEIHKKDLEILEIKKHYKDKLARNKITSEEQKKEWSRIYSELLEEIGYLKKEIENFNGDNNKLLSSRTYENITKNRIKDY